MSAISRLAPHAARVLFGLLLIFFGVNGFLHIIPQAPPPAPARALLAALAVTGYIFPLIRGLEFTVGALLLSDQFVPLALALIAPNVVNIVLFHAVLAPSGMGVAIAVLALEAYLTWSYRESYRSMLVLHAKPIAAAAASAAHATS
jgi:hypothetical protein